jgi:hypothetical protein
MWDTTQVILVVTGAIVVAVVVALVLRVRRQNTTSTRPEQAPNLPVRHARLTFGPENNPLLEVLLRPLAVNERPVDLPLTPKVRENLLDLLPHVPVLAAKGMLAASQTFVMKFSPDIARGIADGKLKVIESKAIKGGIRAAAAGADGRVVANATLLPAAVVKLAAVSLAVWQLAAIITAQKYLADINWRLASIEAGIEAIKEWLDTERKGKLIANLKYLQTLGRDIENHDISEAQAHVFAGELEGLDRECLQMMEQLRLQIETSVGSFKNQTSPGSLVKDELFKQLAGIESLSCQFLLALYERYLAHQLTCALSGRRAAILARIDELHEQLEQFMDYVSGSCKGITGQSKLESVPSIGLWSLWPVTWWVTTMQDGLRTKLSDEIRQAESRIEELWEGIHRLSLNARETLRADLATDADALRLAVTVDADGKPIRLQRILTSSSPLPDKQS